MSRPWRKTFTLEVPRRFNLERVARSHGWYEIPPFRWDPQGGVLAVAVPGPHRSVRRLEIRSAGRGSLALCWVLAGRQRGSALEDEGRALASRVLNLGWDLRPFWRLCRSYEPLGWAPGSGAGWLLRGPSVFSDVVSGICGTNIAWKQAVKAIHLLCTIAPADPLGELRRFPLPDELLAAGEAHLRDTARLGYRAPFILELCRLVRDGAVDLDLPLRSGVEGKEVRAFFRGLPGIGPVTARYLANLYGHFDELAVDSLTVTYIGDKYHRGKKATERQVQARYARFGDLRALAYWFEFLGDVDPATWRGWKPAR